MLSFAAYIVAGVCYRLYFACTGRRSGFDGAAEPAWTPSKLDETCRSSPNSML